MRTRFGKRMMYFLKFSVPLSNLMTRAKMKARSRFCWQE